MWIDIYTASTRLQDFSAHLPSSTKRIAHVWDLTICILSVSKCCGYAFIKPLDGVPTTLSPGLYRSLEVPVGQCEKNNYSACARTSGVTVPP